jgi:hypothetical protein
MRLAELSGSHVEGSLHVAEPAIYDVLAHAADGHVRPTLELQPHNTLLVRYGMLHAHATLPAAVSLSESPQLTLVLKSVMVAFALKAVLHRPYVHIHGRHVTIDLAAIPELESWRELWKFVHHLRFETAPGTLRMQFAVSVKG